jgi:hypothetical protein
MKKFTLEIENDIEYVVIYLEPDEIKNWKKYVKENFDFLKNPNFKFIVSNWSHVFYTKKYKFHNLKGLAVRYSFSLSGDVGNFYLDDVKYETEEEYINELRKRILDSIL